MRATTRRLLPLTLALALALGAVAGAGTLAPHRAAAQSIGVPNAGVCSYAGGSCILTVFAEWGALTATVTLYGRDVCSGYYYSQQRTLYPSPGNPKSAWFWVGGCDRVDIITIGSAGTISAWQGPFVQW